MSSFVVYASSEDSKTVFTNNQPTDFIVQLDRNIKLDAGSYVELLEIRYKCSKKDKEDICVLSDLCQESFLFGKPSTVLGVFQLTGLRTDKITFERSIKLKTIHGQINRFRIYIKGRQDLSPALELLELNVTLRFHNVSY